jgi:hypothetical protein
LKTESGPTAAAVAAWIWETIQTEAVLAFRRAADRVREKFGPTFLQKTGLGRLTIRKDVRDLFNALHGGAVVRGAGRWYLRTQPAFARRATGSRPQQTAQ